MNISNLNCSASIQDGMLVLESGRTIDLGKVYSSLAMISTTQANANSDSDVMAAALEACVTEASEAMLELTGDSGPSDNCTTHSRER